VLAKGPAQHGICSRNLAGVVDPAASYLMLKHGGQAVPVSALLETLPDGSQQWGDAWRELERQQEAEYGGPPLLTPEKVGAAAEKLTSSSY
jgi:hypothetical protein